MRCRYGQAPVIPDAERYFREKWVRGKIENWARRPSGPQRGGGIASAWVSLMRETRGDYQAPIPCDPTDADVTSRTLVALGDALATPLLMLHTTDRTASQIARALAIGGATLKRRLVDAHTQFCERWENERHRYNAELGRRAAPVGALAHVIPQVAEPFDRAYRKPSKLVGKVL